MELHQNQRDDSLLFLQEHALHDPTVPECILLRVLWSDNLRRRLRDLVQPDLHCLTADREGSAGAGRQLHFPLKAEIRTLPNDFRQEHDLAAVKIAVKVPDQQVLLPFVPQNILHRAGKLHLQLQELLCMADWRHARSHRDHCHLLLYLKRSRSQRQGLQLKLLASWTDHLLRSHLGRDLQAGHSHQVLVSHALHHYNFPFARVLRGLHVDFQLCLEWSCLRNCIHRLDIHRNILHRAFLHLSHSFHRWCGRIHRLQERVLRKQDARDCPPRTNK